MKTQGPATGVRDVVAWYDRREPPQPALAGVARADVAVVGGGMMGLMCARALQARGRSVCLLEADFCGGGASGRSSGFITPDSELELADLDHRFGSATARRLWEFAWGGVGAIRDAIAADGIDCGLVEADAFFVASSRNGAKSTRCEHAARVRLGYPGNYCEAADVPRHLGSTTYPGGLRFGGTFGIDPYRACTGLLRGLCAAGVQVFERSPVTRLGDGVIETARGRVDADAIVVCSDRFLPELCLARFEVFHVQTFLAISHPLARTQMDRIFPQGPLLVWDTDLTYKYFRPTPDGRLLIGGGTIPSTYAAREQHDPERAVKRLHDYLETRFPGLQIAFDACWPGLIGISKDFAPVIGRHPTIPTIHFAGGAAGLPWAAALGRYLAERILEGRDDLDATLSVDRRFPIGRPVQSLIGKRLGFALSHALVKYG